MKKEDQSGDPWASNTNTDQAVGNAWAQVGEDSKAAASNEWDAVPEQNKA